MSDRSQVCTSIEPLWVSSVTDPEGARGTVRSTVFVGCAMTFVAVSNRAAAAAGIFIHSSPVDQTIDRSRRFQIRAWCGSQQRGSGRRGRPDVPDVLAEITVTACRAAP